MPIYKCTNNSCALREILMGENKVSIYYDKETNTIIDSGCKCPYCKSDREQIREPGMTTYMTGSPNICKK